MMLPVCANCGIEIRWQPTNVDGEVYCCVGCAEGGPCTCDYERLPQPDERAALARRNIELPPPRSERPAGGPVDVRRR